MHEPFHEDFCIGAVGTPLPPVSRLEEKNPGPLEQQLQAITVVTMLRKLVRAEIIRDYSYNSKNLRRAATKDLPVRATAVGLFERTELETNGESDVLRALIKILEFSPWRRSGWDIPLKFYPNRCFKNLEHFVCFYE